MSRPVSNAGLPTDHDAFKAMTEIEMIAKQAGLVFDRKLPPGLTRAQFGVLNRLARLEAKETISDIARAFNVAQPTMSSTVSRLLEKAYVVTVSDPQDARRKIVQLTPDGATARAEVVESLGPLFDALTGDDGMSVDWGVLLDHLTVLRAHVETL